MFSTSRSVLKELKIFMYFFIYLCVCVLCACVCMNVHHMCVVTLRNQKRVSNSLELELQTPLEPTVNCGQYVDTGDRTGILWERTQCS